MHSEAIGLTGCRTADNKKPAYRRPLAPEAYARDARGRPFDSHAPGA